MCADTVRLVLRRTQCVCGERMCEQSTFHNVCGERGCVNKALFRMCVERENVSRGHFSACVPTRVVWRHAARRIDGDAEVLVRPPCLGFKV
jgi:hypothetical protein